MHLKPYFKDKSSNRDQPIGFGLPAADKRTTVVQLQTGGVALLLVAHTWHEADSGVEHIRIISARRATKLERKVYE